MRLELFVDHDDLANHVASEVPATYAEAFKWDLLNPNRILSGLKRQAFEKAEEAHKVTFVTADGGALVIKKRGP